MRLRLGLTEKGHAAIADRLAAAAIAPDYFVLGADGVFRNRGRASAPEETDLDFMWLSVDISADKRQAEVFDAVTRLRSCDVVQTFNAGLDHPAYGRMADRGFRIVNSSAQAVAISEFVFAYVLQHFHPMADRRAQRARKDWAVSRFREIALTNWLIIGFGPIGRAIAKRAKAFEANVTVIRRSPETSDIVDRAGTLADLPTFVADADVIVLACPITDATRGMMSCDIFAQTKPDALLLNIGRGPLIDDDALLAALDGNQLGGAVLDVFHEEPLPPAHAFWTHPKIEMTPHTSFAGSGGGARWQELAVANVARYARGEALESEVAPDDVPRVG